MFAVYICAKNQHQKHAHIDNTHCICVYTRVPRIYHVHPHKFHSLLQHTIGEYVGHCHLPLFTRYILIFIQCSRSASKCIFDLAHFVCRKSVRYTMYVCLVPFYVSMHVYVYSIGT